MEILTADTFKEQPEAVLENLLQGRSFLLVKNDIPVARLAALRGSDSPTARAPTPDDKICRQQAEYCLGTFGSATLARLLGITQVTLLLLQQDAAYPRRVKGRLQKLAVALVQQQCIWPRHFIVRWWKSSQSELGGSSPVDYLALPWEPGDVRSEAVFTLIRREFLVAGKTDEDISEDLS